MKLTNLYQNEHNWDGMLSSACSSHLFIKDEASLCTFDLVQSTPNLPGQSNKTFFPEYILLNLIISTMMTHNKNGIERLYTRTRL